MGKYDKLKLYDTDRVGRELGAINELAERNRLKRLEISLNHGLITSKKELRLQLEDLA